MSSRSFTDEEMDWVRICVPAVTKFVTEERDSCDANGGEWCRRTPSSRQRMMALVIKFQKNLPTVKHRKLPSRTTWALKMEAFGIENESGSGSIRMNEKVMRVGSSTASRLILIDTRLCFFKF